MLTIREQFLEVQKDVIQTLDNRFVKYLSADLIIIFKGTYPQARENLLLHGTYNSQIKINNVIYNAFSDNFFDLVASNPNREYVVKFSFAHNYCFNDFCLYFEILAHGLSIDVARNYFSEYEFFRNLQLIVPNNEEYTSSYKKYWKEILSRVKFVLENGGHEFYNLFTPEQRIEILIDLNSSISKVQN